MTESSPTHSVQHARSSRGVWTIVAILLLGLGVLLGLYLSPRSVSPVRPAGLVDGLPARPLKVVVIDGTGVGPSPDLLVAAIRAAGGPGDLVCLTAVDSSVVTPIASALGLQASYHPQLFQRTGDDRRAGGVCILSPYGLYDAKPIREGGRTTGVSATAAIDGSAFPIACLDLRAISLEAQQPALSNGVIVAGLSDTGLFSQIKSEAGTLTTDRRSTAPATLTATATKH